MTLLVNYQTYVNDEQASSYYTQWKRSNPVEAAKWATFRDQVLAGGRPTPPSLATSYGRAMIDATLIYLNAVAPPPPPPPPTPTFTKTFLAPNGNIDQFLDSLVAGDIAGLAGPGPYAFSSYQRKAHGTPAQPIVLTSMDTSKPATIAGRFVTYGGDPSTPPGDYWTLRYLGIDGRTSDASSMTIQSRGVRLEQVDFSNWATNIGIIVQSTANDFTIANSRIHDVGPINPRDNMSHGVYDEGNNTHIIDTLVYRCADRGIQDRGGHGSIYEWVTLALNGEGVIFGDDRGAVNCLLRKSILVNQQVADRYLIEALGNANSGNVVDDCFIWNALGWPTIQPNIAPAVVVTNPHTSDPKLDANWMPTASAAIGYGCRTIPPKILANA